LSGAQDLKERQQDFDIIYKINHWFACSLFLMPVFSSVFFWHIYCRIFNGFVYDFTPEAEWETWEVQLAKIKKSNS